MKKKVVYLFILIVLLLTAFPASAKTKEPVGDKISLFTGGSQTFGAGAPFHIAHGFVFSPPDDRPGPNFEFTLEVDGDLIDEDYRTRSHLTWLWVFNFPDGMTGTHTFVARWYMPCYATGSDSCPDKNAPVLFYETTTNITFTP